MGITIQFHIQFQNVQYTTTSSTNTRTHTHTLIHIYTQTHTHTHSYILDAYFIENQSIVQFHIVALFDTNISVQIFRTNLSQKRLISLFYVQTLQSLMKETCILQLLELLLFLMLCAMRWKHATTKSNTWLIDMRVSCNKKNSQAKVTKNKTKKGINWRTHKQTRTPTHTYTHMIGIWCIKDYHQNLIKIRLS